VKETVVDAGNTALSSDHFSGHGKGRRRLLMLLDRWNNQGQVVNDKKTSHACQPLAAWGVSQPFRTTAGLA
jgi:hypothetical protein